MHDLVDYVSEEATNAGKNAARYVLEYHNKAASGNVVEIIPKNGIRYTVPSHINVERMDDILTIRFRVRDVYPDAYINVYFDDERVQHKSAG